MMDDDGDTTTSGKRAEQMPAYQPRRRNGELQPALPHCAARKYNSATRYEYSDATFIEFIQQASPDNLDSSNHTCTQVQYK